MQQNQSSADGTGSLPTHHKPQNSDEGGMPCGARRAQWGVGRGFFVARRAVTDRYGRFFLCFFVLRLGFGGSSIIWSQSPGATYGARQIFSIDLSVGL